MAGRNTPEIFQATKTTLYYIPALVNLPVIFPGMKQIPGRRNCVLGALLRKVKSNFLCPIRPIAQNVAAFDFSKLLQKRDGLITIRTVASRYRQADRYSLPIDQVVNFCVLSSTGPSNTDVPLRAIYKVSANVPHIKQDLGGKFYQETCRRGFPGQTWKWPRHILYKSLKTGIRHRILTSALFLERL